MAQVSQGILVAHPLTVPMLIQQLQALHVEAPRIKDAASGSFDDLVTRVSAEAGRHYPERYGADGAKWYTLATSDAWWFDRGYAAGLRRDRVSPDSCAAFDAGYSVGISRSDDPFPPAAAEVNPRISDSARCKMTLRYVSVPQCYGYGAQKHRLPAGARVVDVGNDAVTPSRRRVVWGGVLWLVNEPERNLVDAPEALVTLATRTPESHVRDAIHNVAPEPLESLSDYRSRVWHAVLSAPHAGWESRFASATPVEIGAWCRAGETLCIWLDRQTHPTHVTQLIRMRYEALILT